MAEITNLNVLYKNNKFKDIIIPLIEHFNKPHTRVANPFEKLAMGTLLSGKLADWDEGSSTKILGSKSKDCCCPDCDIPGFQNCSKIYYLTPCFCISCDGETTHYGTVQPSGNTTLKEDLINLANYAGFASPFSTTINKFIFELDALETSGSNNYTYFSQIVDAYFDNVSFMDYFIDTYAKGTELNTILGMIGGNFREGFESNGLFVETIADGDPGSTKATTTVYIGATASPDSADSAPYFTVFSTDSTEHVFWISIGGAYTQPSPPVGGGVTQVFHEIVLTAAASNTTVGAAIKSTIDAIDTFDPATVAGNGAVTISTPTTGSLPTGQYDYTAADNGLPEVSKIFTYVDGTTGVAAGEVTSIDYRRATVQGLVGSYFKMYDAANDGYLFYYETPANPVDADSLGVAYTTAVAICCFPDYDANNIKNVTTEAIEATGAFTCCPRPAGGCWVEDWNNGDGSSTWVTPCPTKTTYAAVAAGNWANSEGGTSTIGSANQNNTVAAFDGTVFGTDIIDDYEFARIYNREVVPYEKGFGRDTLYLKPVSTQGPYQCYCCRQTLDCVCPPGSIITYIDCPFEQTAADRVGSVMIQTRYPAITEDLPFK